LQTTFNDFTRVSQLKQILIAPPTAKLMYLDEHIPDLIALPAAFETSQLSAYNLGEIIVQDKASCFPACLLDVQNTDGDVIDACAAPGNKTTHLASFCRTQKIHAFEKDKNRSETLSKMVQQAGASRLVVVHAQSDFLLTPPTEEQYKNVAAILLDPSCSGSGIVGRDDEPTLQLPQISLVDPMGRSKPRKRRRKNGPKGSKSGRSETMPSKDTGQATDDEYEQAAAKRLEALAAFQLRALEHAMRFPSAKRIVYSTCSIYEEENEQVVVQALVSDVGQRCGWSIMPRTQQLPGLQKWNIRGDLEACAKSLRGVGLGDTSFQTAEVIADACMRCEKSTEAGTIGFFVAGFERNFLSGEDQRPAQPNDSSSEEWNGCSETE